MKKPKKVAFNKGEIRNRVLEAFIDEPTHAFNYKRIAKKLNIKKEAIKQLVGVIMHELEESGELIMVERGKFKLNHKQQILEGRIDMTNKGAAYLVCENLEEDVFIPPRSMNKALHGDIVKAGLALRKKGRRLEAEVLEVVKRAKTEFVGTVQLHERFGFVVPDDKKMFVDFFIPGSELGKVITGEKVIVELAGWEEKSNNPTGRIVEVLGMAGENDVEMHAILAEFGLPFEFSKKILDDADRVPGEITESEIKKRKDFRKKITFTIDPDDAKDFDDALSFEKINDDLWEIGVHIADVSHYIKEGSLLDAEAYDRATSVYLVDRVVPMLPERLSNDLCSLTPQTDKLCFAAVFQINSRAEVLDRWFGRTIIHSNKRFTYASAQKLLDTKEGELATEMTKLNDLAKLLRKKRFQKGSIGFESIEVKFTLDEKGNPTGVYTKEHGETNELIEEFMLLANKEVAEFVGRKKENGKPPTFVYRVHDDPDPEKIEQFRNFVSKFGYGFSPKTNKNISDSFNKLFKEIEGKTEEYVVEQMAIRTMAKAIYTTNNIGHYGLAFSEYTHFTSPIRRYPDVIVHRLLQHYLDGGKSPEQAPVEETCKQASKMERLAVEAERASIKYKQVQYLQNKVGLVFEGIISGMNDYGMFVEIVENKCEGMVRLREIKDDYYFFDSKEYSVKGSRKGRIFNIGDKLDIRIVKADLIRKQLDFQLA